jgi:hypothetical protein
MSAVFPAVVAGAKGAKRRLARLMTRQPIIFVKMDGYAGQARV